MNLGERTGHTIILLGHRGSGRTEAIRALEDHGVCGLDNLPPQLLPEVVRIRTDERYRNNHNVTAAAIDLIDGESVLRMRSALKELKNMDILYTLITLEARETTALQRIVEKNNVPALDIDALQRQILLEKELLRSFKDSSKDSLDTSNLSVYDLRERLGLLIKGSSIHHSIHIEFHSFGFKYGPSLHSDIVFDVRFLSNPYYIPELRELNGLDDECAEYVLVQPAATFFIDRLTELVTELAPHYSRLGKARLRIGIGCTGGQHRSVAISRELGNLVRTRGFNVSVHHREISRL